MSVILVILNKTKVKNKAYNVYNLETIKEGKDGNLFTISAQEIVL